jgi:hypothetical protein
VREPLPPPKAYAPPRSIRGVEGKTLAGLRGLDRAPPTPQPHPCDPK